MSSIERLTLSPWPLWRKIIFRFSLIFILSLIAPWAWLFSIPGFSFLSNHYYQFTNWIVTYGNQHFLHVRPVLVPVNGSGDTSYGWAELFMQLLASFVFTIIWSLVDYKRKGYTQLNYWLCLLARYYIAFIAFTYGVLKMFLLQMPFPNLSELATPLGDFLPMRLSWMFIGYSGPYQFFSGCMEVSVALLLIFRRTATLGVMVATAVFVNVMMLNLSYDIPVKIFSMEIVAICLFLLANEAKRISCFFFLNKPAPACSIYHYRLPKRWMRIAAPIVKFIIIAIVAFKEVDADRDYYKEVHKPKSWQPIAAAVYQPAIMVVNKDTIIARPNDTVAWQDLIFEDDGSGSVQTKDRAFHQLYGRGYFTYGFDTTKHTLDMLQYQDNPATIATFIYSIPDSNTLLLKGVREKDSLFMLLKKSTHHYQLAEKQFHWLSESNR